MLMGREPGGATLPPTNGFSGAQRYASAPLQPYPLPQPVPRPPAMPMPAPPSPAPLPAPIEAWRSQLLSMHPLLLMRTFGMSAAELRQMLADPQTATLLYAQTHTQGSPFGGSRGGAGGNRDHPGQRAADSFRAGMADFSLGNVATALGFGARALQSPLSLGLEAMGSLAFPGRVASPMPQFTGEINVRDIVARNPELAAALRDLELESNPQRAMQKKARLERQIREIHEREAMAKRGLGSGGWGMRGATEARDIGSGGGSRGGGGRTSDSGGEGGKSGSTADRNDR
jgi:hypothetical protein